MGLEKLVEEVDAKARRDAERIEAESRREAEAVIRKAEDEAKQITEGALKDAEENARRRRVEEVSRARMAGKLMVAKAREDVVLKALEGVWSRILDCRKSREYGKLVRGLAEEAVKDVGGGYKLYCRREDKELLKGLKVSALIECAGGVVVEDENGNVRVDCTLESLFEDSGDKLSELIYGRLFPQK